MLNHKSKNWNNWSIVEMILYHLLTCWKWRTMTEQDWINFHFVASSSWTKFYQTLIIRTLVTWQKFVRALFFISTSSLQLSPAVLHSQDYSQDHSMDHSQDYPHTHCRRIPFVRIKFHFMKMSCQELSLCEQDSRVDASRSIASLTSSVQEWIVTYPSSSDFYWMRRGKWM